ncbi:unnamed protein product [Cuscuta campestris]|uniref:Reverse transcriptase domain-containing protein n=1 Tax=Cuscuta campestris TaxID=132261 RepID=A0A484NT07_9ASTE|nr:unnamed protein product [Cuscuta campestris]
MPGGAFTPYPSSLAQFVADPASAQALQGYQQVMAMMQQEEGFMPFAYPGMMAPIMPPLVSTPSTFVPRMIPIRSVNLTGTMNEAAPSNVHEVDEAEQEAARRRKGKAIAKPSKTRDSAFKRLRDKEDGPRKSTKLRLGLEMGQTSAMERLGGNRPAQSRRSVARKLRALEEKVEEKAGVKKHTLAKSPFSDRVHAQKLRRKVKLDVEKFTGKEDPNLHLDTFHNVAQMAGCTDAEECLIFFSSLRGRPVEWFNGLPHGRIGSFEKLAEVFRKKYQDNCIKRKKLTYLNTVGQREKESLTQFLTHWRDEVDKVEEMDDKTAMSLLMNAFQSGDLYTEFCRRPPSSYQEAYNTTWEYAEAEVLNKSKQELEEGYTKVKTDKPKKDDQTGGSKPRATYDGSVHQIRDEKKGEQPKRAWTEKWCTYHQSNSHNTADCRNVKAVLKEMALKGELGEGHYKLHCWSQNRSERPGINQVRAIISMAHLCMKFYTPNGIGEERGDQKNARSCYLEAVNKMTRQFEQIELVSKQVDKGEGKARIEPDANTEEIQIDTSNPERKVRIGADLQEELRTEIVQVLTRYKSLFAWSVVDMPGIDRSVICHRLSFLEGSRHVRQKKRFLASERRYFVKKEVKDLLEFNIEYRPRMAIKGQAMADFLVEMTGHQEEELARAITEPWWSMSVDGASGPKRYGGGGLRLAKTLQITCLKIKSDSSLVVGHINGNMEAKGEKMQKYIDLARALLKDLTQYVMEQILRGENTNADLLSKLMQAAPEHVSKLVRIETLEKASIEGFSVSVIEEDGQSNPDRVERDDVWMDDLVRYYMTGQFPEDEDMVRKVKLRAPRFQMLDGRLYKRAFGGPLLRCFTRAEGERVIAEVHDGVCAAHQMSRTLAQRIILLGYFWPTMNQDCERYVQRCKTCQVFYKFPGRPATYYHLVSNVISCARFGMDIIGAFPQAQGRKKPQFRNPGFTKYLEDFRITHNKPSVAYLQGNGQVENVNRTIVDGIKKRLGEAGTNWLEELPHIIWAYQVTSRRATGETPFVLTYRCEGRLPIETKIMTFWEKIYEEKGNEEDQMAELNLLEERRMVTEAKMIEYQQAAKAYHDNRVGPRYFQVGDEVLRRREASKQGDGGKLAKKWEVPYRVTAILRPGTYNLETMEGRELESWNEMGFYGGHHCLFTKLKHLKHKLSCWNKNKLGNIFSLVKEAEEEARMAEQEFDNDPNITNKEILNLKKSHLAFVTNLEYTFWKQKSNIKWLADGDVNTKFFHNFVKEKRRKQHISCLLNDNGESINTTNELEQLITSHYNSLFNNSEPSCASSDYDQFMSAIPHVLLQSHNEDLLRLPLEVEIKNTLWAMDPNSAVGPDGYIVFFFKHCWDIIKKELISACQEVWLGTPLPDAATSSNLVLIPKVDNPSSVHDFRPICLSTVTIKLASKCLANRLSKLLTILISEEQGAYMMGKDISEQILLIKEMVHNLDRKAWGGNIIVKLDLSKAFDKLKWSFLFDVLLRFGFSNRFIHIIHNLMNSSKYSLVVNGKPCVFFIQTRGIKQGDPLSLQLFIIANEAFSKNLNMLMNHGVIGRYNCGNNSIPISHLSYADDIIIFCNSSCRSLVNLKFFLKTYQECSGQNINKQKSSFFVGKYQNSRKIAELEKRLDMQHKKLPFTYLGISMDKGITRTQHCNQLLTAFDRKLGSWLFKQLDQAGRLILINHVLNTLPIFFLGSNTLPKSVQNILKQKMSRFWWKNKHH